MNRVALAVLTLTFAACGVPEADEAEVGVAREALTTSVQFWYGNANTSSGYGILNDVPDNGLLGWTGPLVSIPFGKMQANAFSLDVDAQSSASTQSGDATLYWRVYAHSTGDFRILTPASFLVDGYARATGFYGRSADVDVYLRVRVRAGTRLPVDRWYEITSVTSSYGEKTSSFSSLQVNVAHDFTFPASSGEAITYEASLYMRSSTGALTSAFVGVRDFAIYTNAKPNTSHAITLYEP